MIKDINLRLSPEDASLSSSIINAAAKKLKVSASSVNDIQIERKSIDARRYPIVVDMSVKVFINEKKTNRFDKINYKDCSNAKEVVIVGCGPAGLFAALRFIEKGFKPIVLERGDNVHDRKVSIATMIKNNRVNEHSNYCYGEGGAGAFSDGKLYTRSTKKGDVKQILAQFIQHGADDSIIYEAHPHLGTDKLPSIIEDMRNTIISHGGIVKFKTMVTDILIEDGKSVGVVCKDGKTYLAPVILATGHSNDEIYYLLEKKGIPLEAKTIAVGVRVEHPQHVIDEIQYKSKEGRGKYLPPAEYRFVTQVKDRGVYSFCMCPGGVIVPSHTSEGYSCVNGMSSSTRGGKFANSAFVVEIKPEDLPQFEGPLGVLKFQKALEKRTWDYIGGGLEAPGQRMVDFVKGKASTSLPETSYAPGLVGADLNELYPAFIADRLAGAFRYFGRNARGFLSKEAILIGTETRTSSPVRITRDQDTYMSVDGLFPCGEGAGYAGGIVSSAIDGLNTADAVIKYLS
ncbi:MAG: NAD(P)/FAD-dependent oxidoreductase [Spirochaetaceae bacterium]|nr:NAD(P)/FAD-dependent oxidoreductase [Spirochaetaceae bacterium]